MSEEQFATLREALEAKRHILGNRITNSVARHYARDTRLRPDDPWVDLDTIPFSQFITDLSGPTVWTMNNIGKQSGEQLRELFLLPTIAAPHAKQEQSMDEQEEFTGWFVVEIMGRRKLSGFVRETVVAGFGMLRIDVPADPPFTQYLPPASLYALTPCSEDLARQFAASNVYRPVTRYELPAPPPQQQAGISTYPTGPYFAPDADDDDDDERLYETRDDDDDEEV